MNQLDYGINFQIKEKWRIVYKKNQYLNVIVRKEIKCKVLGLIVSSPRQKPAKSLAISVTKEIINLV